MHEKSIVRASLGEAPAIPQSPLGRSTTSPQQNLALTDSHRWATDSRILVARHESMALACRGAT
jgi:hypothetical protein